MPPNDDILREILIRLPAESLIRSRAVCKRWRAIIDEPPFARAHQHLHPINKSIIIIKTDWGTRYSLDLEALSFSNGDQTIAATPLDFSDYRPVGACNGLVLTDTPLEICNPLTNERLDLPLHPGEYAQAYGLGYDYVTDDYKAVSILSTNPRQTNVYSLKSNSWRMITNCPRDPEEGAGIFVCGALNWIFWGADCSYMILALDLGTEKYTVLQMPRRRRDRYHNATFLDVLGGCLILCYSGFNGELDGWVMKDYGDEGSWMELFSIDQRSRVDCFLIPVGFIMRKEEEKKNKMRLQVFMKEKYQPCFFLFDVKTNSSKRVFIQGRDPELYSQQMFPGTKFCLHENCGGGGSRKMPSNPTRKSSTNKNSAVIAKRFVFSIEEDIANDNRF